MKSENLFLSSIKESFSHCIKNKMLFMLVLFAQLLFFSSFFFTSFHYQSKILENLNSINTYVSEQETSEIDITKNIIEQEKVFGPDPQLITIQFDSMRQTFRAYVFASFFIFVFFFSLICSLSHMIIGNKNFKSIFVKSILISSFCLAIIFGMFYWITDTSLFALSSELSNLMARYVFFAFTAGIIFYFMIITFALLGKKNLENLIKKSFYAGIRKIHYALFSIAAIAALILSIVFFGVYFIEEFAIMGFVLLILGFIMMAFGRILIIKIIEKIGN